MKNGGKTKTGLLSSHSLPETNPWLIVQRCILQCMSINQLLRNSAACTDQLQFSFIFSKANIFNREEAKRYGALEGDNLFSELQFQLSLIICLGRTEKDSKNLCASQ